MQYARDVVTGRVVACKWVKLACARHINDLRRAAEDETYPFVFDTSKANRVCRFIESLPHIKGTWKTSTIQLEPWQKFVLAAIFGWVHRHTGFRRFRVAYICIPRKNGKSIIAAGIGLYMFVGDGEHGAEVFAGANTEDQAWKVFEPAKRIVLRTPALQQAFDITVPSPKKFNTGHGAMHVLSKASRFETMVGNPGDGDNPSCSIHDEFHEAKSADQVDTMRTGMGARNQPLQAIITTAGDTIEGPCYALQRDIEQMLEGSIELDHVFGIIYTIDKGDDWTTLEAAQKANPNYGVSVSATYIAEELASARTSPRNQARYKTKNLNIWVNAKAGWMNMEAWDACCDPTLSEDDFAHAPCWGGLDLANKWDITASVKIFKRNIDGEDHYYVFGRYYMPRRTADLPEKRHYQAWEAEGYLKVTDGDIIDHDAIEQDIVNDSAAHQLEDVGYDPYNATDLVKRLTETYGITCTEIPQRIAHLSEPMKWVEALVIAKRLHHDGNKVLKFGVANVIAAEDRCGNVFPTKERGEVALAKKIDPAVALIIAMNRAMIGAAESGSVYDNRGILTV